MVMEGVRAYLLPDGRENGLLVPAEGHIFLTSYRIIFLGTACHPQGERIECSLLPLSNDAAILIQSPVS